MPRKPRKRTYRVTKNVSTDQKSENPNDSIDTEISTESDFNISSAGSENVTSESSVIIEENPHQEAFIESNDGAGQQVSIQDGSNEKTEKEENAETINNSDIKLEKNVVEANSKQHDNSVQSSFCDSFDGNSSYDVSIHSFNEYAVCYDEDVKQLLLEHEQEPYVIAIDVGTMSTKVIISHPTTNSSFCLSDETGESIIPTVVGFTKDKQLFGQAAVDYIKDYVNSVISDIKRILGREKDDPLIISNKSKWPFKISGDNRSTAEVSVEQKPGLWVTWLPEEVMQKFLERLLRHATTVKHNIQPSCTVLTVPSFFNNRQRSTLAQSAKNAGFKNIHLINEITAEALYCLKERMIKTDENSVFFHFGAGSMDCSIISIKNSHIIVKSCCSNMYCGGQDLTNELTDHIKQLVGAEKFSKEDISNLRLICEEVKKTLSTSFESNVNYPLIDGSIKVTREEFENICFEKFQNIATLVQDTLHNTDLTFKDMDRVILTGESCQIPLVRAMFRKMFPDSKIIRVTDPHLAAKGAAEYAIALDSHQQAVKITDIYPYRIFAAQGPDVLEIFPYHHHIPARREVIIDMGRVERMVFEVKEQYPAIGSEEYHIGYFNLNNVERNNNVITFAEDPNGLFIIEQGTEINSQNKVHYFK